MCLPQPSIPSLHYYYYYLTFCKDGKYMKCSLPPSPHSLPLPPQKLQSSCYTKIPILHSICLLYKLPPSLNERTPLTSVQYGTVILPESSCDFSPGGWWVELEGGSDHGDRLVPLARHSLLLICHDYQQRE